MGWNRCWTLSPVITFIPAILLGGGIGSTQVFCMQHLSLHSALDSLMQDAQSMHFATVSSIINSFAQQWPYRSEAAIEARESGWRRRAWSLELFGSKEWKIGTFKLPSLRVQRAMCKLHAFGNRERKSKFSSKKSWIMPPVCYMQMWIICISFIIVLHNLLSSDWSREDEERNDAVVL